MFIAKARAFVGDNFRVIIIYSVVLSGYNYENSRAFVLQFVTVNSVYCSDLRRVQDMKNIVLEKI